MASASGGRFLAISRRQSAMCRRATASHRSRSPSAFSGRPRSTHTTKAACCSCLGVMATRMSSVACMPPPSSHRCATSLAAAPPARRANWYSSATEGFGRSSGPLLGFRKDCTSEDLPAPRSPRSSPKLSTAWGSLPSFLLSFTSWVMRAQRSVPGGRLFFGFGRCFAAAAISPAPPSPLTCPPFAIVFFWLVSARFGASPPFILLWCPSGFGPAPFESGASAFPSVSFPSMRGLRRRRWAADF